ncbi:MAG: Fe-S cluster assembly protein SufD [Planctomycetota bacterium]
MPAATETTRTADPFLAAWEAFEPRAARGPAWLRPLRQAAIAHYAELGIPTTRHEDWRYTNLAPLVRARPQLAPDASARVRVADLRPFLWEPAGTPRLVFVNGRFAPHLSEPAAPRGVQMGTLAGAAGGALAALEAQFNRYAQPGQHAFAAVNTAFLEDGAHVLIAPGAIVEAPLHLVFVSTSEETPTFACPRTLVIAGANSQCTIVESYVGLPAGKDAGPYFTNAVTELVAGENAVVDHYKVQREAENAFHIGALYLHQQRAATVTSHNLSLGGGLVRHDLNVVLAGEGGDCHLNGLYVVGGEQHVDNHLRVEHAAPHCNSREVYKGVLDGQSRGVFTGRIIVRKGAQKTDGKQTNNNLLLSGEAQVDTKPQLEIFADDVKCTHGATIGQLDADALFYLRSRGVPADAARGLLTYAFAGESLDQIRVAPLRAQIARLVRARLPHGELFEDLS